ncbi:MAG: GNAT family N-acetyltransferase [Hamadaea sp.]|uniref:GNAT family N-acetyltransferase n=1 Tax=Hamadaea sp. TaxID=2024425 RepID=UPI0018431B07|nr:GNAT family N-acetyltransferase [Hamadaea sp.]NUT21806.1 GNAT family N-acetyltransferase [Hamadaea sp.]
MKIRLATSLADINAAEPLFDGPVQPAAARRFLDADGHHLLVAYTDGEDAVGMIVGVETTMPDKGTEMFLSELGVDEAHRNQGIGRALVQALRDLAATRGCTGMWVPVDHDNEPAHRTYLATQPTGDETVRVFSWD